MYSRCTGSLLHNRAKVWRGTSSTRWSRAFAGGGFGSTGVEAGSGMVASDACVAHAEKADLRMMKCT